MLVDSGAALGLTAIGTDVFISKMPPSPDACVTLYDTGGIEGDGYPEAATHPMVTVHVRGDVAGYQAAYALALAIRTYLYGLGEVTTGDYRYFRIWPSNEPLLVGYDRQDRPMLTLTLRTIRTYGTGS